MKQRKQTGQFMKRSRLYRINVEQKKINDRIYRKNTYLAVIILAILFSLIIIPGFYKYLNRPMLDPRGSTIIPQVVEVKAQEPKPFCRDAISCVRDVGEKLGANNKDITKMIRIARCESNFNQYAKNANSTAKGIYQFIDGTWRANCLKDGNVYDFKANIECGWKVYLKQNDTPWHSSAKCWNK